MQLPGVGRSGLKVLATTAFDRYLFIFGVYILLHFLASHFTRIKPEVYWKIAPGASRYCIKTIEAAIFVFRPRCAIYLSPYIDLVRSFLR